MSLFVLLFLSVSINFSNLLNVSLNSVPENPKSNYKFYCYILGYSEILMFVESPPSLSEIY